MKQTKPSTGTIALEGIEVYSYHGVYPRERKDGNRYVVDVWLEKDLREAMRSDELDDTLDYQKIYKFVLEVMAVPANLLEHLVWKIGKGIMSKYPDLVSVKVRVTKSKPLAMGQCRQTYVEMLFGKNDF